MSPSNVNDDGNTIFQTKEGQNGNPDTNINYWYNINDQLRLSNTVSGTESYPVTYQYDAYGNRTRRYEANGNAELGDSDIQYTWDIVNNNVVYEKSNLLSFDLYHIYGATGLEATVNGQTGEIISYYLGDLRGNVVANVEQDPYNYSFSKYDDFGNLVYGDTQEPTEVFKFLGKYGITMESSETGHYYIKARHYDAKLGRFLTEDPIWSSNLYPYGGNNPISNIDTNGANWYNSYSTGVFSGLEGEYYKDSYARCEDTTNPGACKAGKWVGFSGVVGGLVGEALSESAVGRAFKKGATTVSSLERGRKVHSAYKTNLHNPVNGLYKEFTGVKGVRPDFVDFNTKTIYELKPNNPRQIREGQAQLNKYKSAFESQYGGTWSIVLDLY